MDWYGVNNFSIQPEISILSHTDLSNNNNNTKVKGLN